MAIVLPLPQACSNDGWYQDTGGFGCRLAKIDFSSYHGIQFGSVNAQGERMSLFTPTKD